MNNDFEIRGDVTAIMLNSPKYGKFETLIDTVDLEMGKVEELQVDFGILTGETNTLIEKLMEENYQKSKQLELAMNAIYKYSEMIVIDGEDRPQDVGQVAREALEAINRLLGGNETP